MNLPNYDQWRLQEPERNDKEPEMDNDDKIDQKFQSLTKAQREAFRVLLHGLGDGIEISDFHTRRKTRKANTISEPCSVACMETIGGHPILGEAKYDNLANGMFDKDGVLDQTLNFILDKILEL